MPFIRNNLANIFTLLNLFFGFTGIVNVLYGDLVTGALMLILAAFCDLADGFFARALSVQSAFGKQLDSLSDVVSFGVLPAFILHSMILLSHADWIQKLYFTDIPAISFFPFILAAAAALRLARFNIDPVQNHYFKGLPAPASALVVASLPLIMKYNLYGVGYQTIYLDLYLLNPWTIIIFSILLSLLMLSDIPLFALKFSNFGLKENWYRYSIIILFLFCFLFLRYLAFPLTVLFFIALSLALRKKIITA